MCALERAYWCPCSAAARCWCRVLLAVRVVCTVWSGHAGGAQGALLQVLPEGGALRGCCQSGVRASNHAFGAGMLVSGCLWKVLLEGAVKLADWCCCKDGT